MNQLSFLQWQPGSNCCKVLSKATKGDGDDLEEARVSLASGCETSVDSTTVTFAFCLSKTVWLFMILRIEA